MGAIQAMAAMDLEAVAAERTRGLLQGALAAKRTEDALKICEDFEMEVSSTPPLPLPCGAFCLPCEPRHAFKGAMCSEGAQGLTMTQSFESCWWISCDARGPCTRLRYVQNKIRPRCVLIALTLML